VGVGAGCGREVAECPQVGRDQRQGGGCGGGGASNAELSGHGDRRNYICYFVCQPELNPSSSLTRAAVLQSGEETAETENGIPDTDGAREQDEGAAGSLIGQHCSQERPGAEGPGGSDPCPDDGRSANQGQSLHRPTIHSCARSPDAIRRGWTNTTTKARSSTARTNWRNSSTASPVTDARRGYPPWVFDVLVERRALRPGARVLEIGRRHRLV